MSLPPFLLARSSVRNLQSTYIVVALPHSVLSTGRSNPPTIKTGPEFQQWMCNVHNTVNANIGKPIFDCNKLV